MLKYILSNIFNISNTGFMLDIVYYSVILISLSVCAILYHNRLIALGYEKKKALTFILTSLIMSYPVGIVSARMVGIFYFPPQFWSIDFFINQLLYGKHVTFHAAIILPIIVIFFLTVKMKFRIAEVWDAFFIYMPLGHAIGRVACLLVGCCWGNPVSLSIFGQTFTFDNPVPLYAILINVVIFFILRSLFNWIYSREETRRYSGLVISLYLILYGNVRLILELLRTTKVVFMGLTQAQIVMIFFIAAGSLLFMAVMFKNFLRGIDTGSVKSKKLISFSLTGLFGYFLAIGLLYWFLSSNHIIKWPFHPVHTIAEAYQTIFEYAPVLAAALFSVIWLLPAGLPVFKYFKWKQFSGSTLFIGIAISLGYTIYMLKPLRFGLHIASVWPPVLILSLLNAIAEETVFRVVLYGLIQKISNRMHLSNIIQSLVYASIHIFIGGNLLAMQAFILGMILGLIREKNNSVIPCIICHFCVDLGAIGYPILTS